MVSPPNIRDQWSPTGEVCGPRARREEAEISLGVESIPEQE